MAFVYLYIIYIYVSYSYIANICVACNKMRNRLWVAQSNADATRETINASRRAHHHMMPGISSFSRNGERRETWHTHTHTHDIYISWANVLTRLASAHTFHDDGDGWFLFIPLVRFYYLIINKTCFCIISFVLLWLSGGSCVCEAFNFIQWLQIFILDIFVFLLCDR